jgi:soluble lytic murein transglycosylase-like protein
MVSFCRIGVSLDTSCVRLVLIASLFIPAAFSFKYLPQKGQSPESARGVQLAEKPRPQELVKIYSIVRSNRPDIGDVEAWRISEVILQESSRHGLDPMLVLALIDVESKFQYAAVSPAGARGIMQILPGVAEGLANEIGLSQHFGAQRFRPEFLDNPILNIKLGVYYLKDLKKSFRTTNLALTAYNLGPTETRNRLENDIELSDDYTSAVLSTYQKYKQSKEPAF